MPGKFEAGPPLTNVDKGSETQPTAPVRLPVRLPRTLVLVGLMGAGKTAIGRRLATRFKLPFVDADHEIERAAGCPIPDIFATWGEAAFRDCERRIIVSRLQSETHILSTGGGAFLDPETRRCIRARGISLWLRADLEILLARTSRRNNRPLLQTGDPRKILSDLIAIRHPVYAEADITVDSTDSPPDETVDHALEAIAAFLASSRQHQSGNTPGADAPG